MTGGKTDQPIYWQRYRLTKYRSSQNGATGSDALTWVTL